MKKISTVFFSVLIGAMLSFNVASAQIEQDTSAVAQCADLVLPNYYSPGISPIDLKQIMVAECGELMVEELKANDLPVDAVYFTAGIFFYTTEWLNRMLQDVLHYIEEGCPVINDAGHVDI